MEKDADSMIVKPVEYAASEYSSTSEMPPPVSFNTFKAKKQVLKTTQKLCKNNTKMQLKFKKKS